MKPYEDLTWRGKLRRFRQVAQTILDHYELEVRRLDLIGYDTNIMYRVYAADGAQYALRLANGHWRTNHDARSEVLWLDALARETTVPAPRILRTRDGSAVVSLDVVGLPPGHHAVLMSWLPGTLLGKRLTETNLVKMGELFGQLHQHGGAWQPPAGFTNKRFDRMLSRGEPDLFLSDKFSSAYSPETLKILRLMRERVDAAYAALDPTDLRVIHCDLWHDNIKVYQGRLYPFDFEDTIWGYRLHDLAMAMLDLYEVMDMDRYEHLLAAFRVGYERYLTWPAGDMTILQIGRILWRTNYVTQFGVDWLKKDAEFNAALFERYLATGKLIPPLVRPRN